MNEGLEKLKNPFGASCENGVMKYYYTKEQYEVIEKELKRLEDIDSILNTGGGIWAENGIVSKKLKALEIIKEKSVDVALLKLSENVERYNAQIKLTHLTIPYFELTQEEYDLLKEVML